MENKNQTMLQRGITLLTVIIGNAMYAAVAVLFLLPSGLPTGGTTGIALLVNRLTGLSVSMFVLGFNIVGAGYFTAIERPKESLIISLGRGMVIIAAALAVCIGVGGGEGIWWAPAVSELMCLGVTLILVYLYTRRETFKCIS